MPRKRESLNEKVPVTDEQPSTTESPPGTPTKETVETPIGGEPTALEKQTLPCVGEKLPFRVFLVAIVELCERFTYYGCQVIPFFLPVSSTVLLTPCRVPSRTMSRNRSVAIWATVVWVWVTKAQLDW